jgi:hypothetical protein
MDGADTGHDRFAGALERREASVREAAERRRLDAEARAAELEARRVAKEQRESQAVVLARDIRPQIERLASALDELERLVGWQAGNEVLRPPPRGLQMSPESDAFLAARDQLGRWFGR